MLQKSLETVSSSLEGVLGVLTARGKALGLHNPRDVSNYYLTSQVLGRHRRVPRGRGDVERKRVGRREARLRDLRGPERRGDRQRVGTDATGAEEERRGFGRAAPRASFLERTRWRRDAAAETPPRRCRGDAAATPPRRREPRRRRSPQVDGTVAPSADVFAPVEREINKMLRGNMQRFVKTDASLFQRRRRPVRAVAVGRLLPPAASRPRFAPRRPWVHTIR